MSIQDLGAIGELVGAIAVIVTLIYLAIQTRQSRIAVEQSAKFAGLQATAGIMGNYNHWRELLLSRSEYAGILVKANRGEEMSEEEKIQLTAIFQELFLAGAFAYLSSQNSGSLQPVSSDVEYLIGYLRENPSGIEIWHEFKSTIQKLVPDFAAQIDELLEGQSVAN